MGSMPYTAPLQGAKAVGLHPHTAPLHGAAGRVACHTPPKAEGRRQWAVELLLGTAAQQGRVDNGTHVVDYHSGSLPQCRGQWATEVLLGTATLATLQGAVGSGTYAVDC